MVIQSQNFICKLTNPSTVEKAVKKSIFFGKTMIDVNFQISAKTDEKVKSLIVPQFGVDTPNCNNFDIKKK